jgi:hypothetical protein
MYAFDIFHQTHVGVPHLDQNTSGHINVLKPSGNFTYDQV